jgi:hypothetical protein
MLCMSLQACALLQRFTFTHPSMHISALYAVSIAPVHRSARNGMRQ